MTVCVSHRRLSRKKQSGHNVSRKIASPVIPAMDSELYRQVVEHTTSKRSIAVLLLVDSVDEGFLQVFSEAVQRHKSQQFRYFCGSLEDSLSWLLDLLERSNMAPRDKEQTESLYIRGGEESCCRVCVLALFGAKKQFAIFPELANSDRYLLTNSNYSSGSDITTEGASKDRRQPDSAINSLMSTFGFEDDDNNEPSRAFVKGLFTVWMERLEDGSLKRYSTEEWPSWHQ